MADKVWASDANSADDDGTTHSQSLTNSTPRPRSGWLVGIITGLITGIVVAFYVAPTGQATVTMLRDHFVRPSCGKPQWLLQVPDSEVFASSYYFQLDRIPPYGLLHVPGSTIDGDLRTAWLQFWPSPSDGLSARKNQPNLKSDYIEWSFSKPYSIRLICIVDGWTEDSNTYKDTLPISVATVYAPDSARPIPQIGSPEPSGQCPSREQKFKDYLKKNGTIDYR